MTVLHQIVAKMKPTTLEKQNIIKKYIEDGLSNRKIAEKANVSTFTVNKIARKLFPDRKTAKAGRPSKLTEREKTFCVRKITLDKKENAVEVQKSLKEELNIDVTARTVRNVLKKRV